MRTIAIVGVGLIGGSFGLAMRKAGFDGEILGVSSPGALKAGLERGAITREATLEHAILEADLLYLAQPVDVILVTLERIGPLVPHKCLITDVGSTKRLIVQQAQSCLGSGHFLGGHPMAGKERRGAAEADADLFHGRPYVLTRPEGAVSHPLEKIFRSWLERLGAQVIEMEAAEHDQIVAFTSHLPQLLSTALSTTLQEYSGNRASEVFGTGLLDMTRLALSEPELWLSILATNKEEVRSAIDAFSAVLSEIRTQLDSQELRYLFAKANRFAREIRR
jgi:prephenate dehydrogenase